MTEIKDDDLQISVPIDMDNLGEDGYINVLIYFKPNGAQRRQELFKAKYTNSDGMTRKSQVGFMNRNKYQGKIELLMSHRL